MTDLHTARSGRVAVLTLSRPPHNYFDAGLVRTLADALADVDHDPQARVCVLRAEGRNFCAGASFGAGSQPDPAAVYAQAARLMDRRKPLVAAVNGAAIGGGFGLALVADLRVGTSGTAFHANFARLGICAGFGLSFTLPRLIGPQKARDLLLTARRVTGAEALQLGLLDRVVEQPEALDGAAMALASAMAENAPGALLATRTLLDEGEREGFAAAIERELQLQVPLFASTDFIEGVAAARERRTPVFSDGKETAA